MVDATGIELKLTNSKSIYSPVLIKINPPPHPSPDLSPKKKKKSVLCSWKQGRFNCCLFVCLFFSQLLFSVSVQ